MVDWSLSAHVLLPLGLGLFGFVEPCTVGGHLVFLEALRGRARASQWTALLLFTTARTLAMGTAGLMVVVIGQFFVATQKGFWLLFGLAYVALGALYVAGKAGVLIRRIGLDSTDGARWRSTIALGLVLGVNVPACAAPLLFAVVGLTVGSQTYALGFVTVGLFGFALSAPLMAMALVPAISRSIESLSAKSNRLHRVVGGLFVAVGFWSMWFGLYVNPADWQLQP